MFSFSFEEIALQKYFLVFIFILLELLSREDCCFVRYLNKSEQPNMLFTIDPMTNRLLRVIVI